MAFVNQSSQATQAGEVKKEPDTTQVDTTKKVDNIPEDKLAVNDDFWDTIQKEQDPTTPTAQPAQPQPDPNDVEDRNAKFLERHIEGLRLMEGVDTVKLGEELREGKTDMLTAAMENVAAKTYQSSLVAVNGIINKRVEEAVASAVSQSRVRGAADLAVEQMHDGLKYTTQGKLKPVAEAVFAKALERTGNKKEAIEQTDKWFQAIGEEVNKGRDPGSLRPGRGGFNNGGPKTYSETVELSPDDLEEIFGV